MSGLDEIRIVVRPPGPTSAGTVTRIVKAALATTRWGAERRVRSSGVDAPDTSPARHDVVTRIEATEASVDTMAGHAHELVQVLYRTERFLRVEADLPTAAHDPTGATATQPPRRRGAAGTEDCGSVVEAADRDWALRALRVDDAAGLMTTATAGGRGIVIGHPDTGYSNHPQLGQDRLDLDRDRDVISDDDDARDPLRPPKKTILRPLPNPGHGTSTGSIIVGDSGRSPGALRGVAPAATLLPIRAIESVVQVFDSDVAKAVRWAIAKDCHIVSMSLGGKGLFNLEEAVDEAVASGMIVLAAAGNQVGFVTAPASYANCIAVAATTATSVPWAGSSRGRRVDLAAPGACVWSARFDWKPSPPVSRVGQSNGTSYAVAHVAGVVALWLAHRSHQSLVDRYGRGNVQAVLRHLLRRPGVCVRPDGWDSARFGAGILDAAALLAADLPAPHEIRAPRGAAAALADDPVERLAASTGLDRSEMAEIVDRALGPGSHADIGLIRRFEGELAYHLADPASRTVLVGPQRRGAAVADRPSLSGASPEFRARLARTL